MISRTFRPEQYEVNDTTAVERAIEDAGRVGGCVRFAAGDYYITRPLNFYCSRSVALLGEGEGVTKLHFTTTSGPRFSFSQVGMQQPYGLTVEGLSLTAAGACGTALSVDYHAPAFTNDHYRPSVRLSNVLVESGSKGAWANGIDLADTWNATLDNVFVSGSAAEGVWNNLSGSGITLRRMCVNAHLSNVRTNFWATGLLVHADSRCNDEGIFAANCSMVGVKRGVWLQGNAAVFPHRLSTFTWTGGMIECRVGGVVGGSAAFHLQNFWDAKITGVEMLTETLDGLKEKTFGVIAQDSKNIVISACGFNAFTNAIATTGECSQILESSNTFVNCASVRS